MHIHSFVVRFSIWVEFPILEVERDVQEVDNFLVCLYCYFEVKFTECSCYIFLDSLCLATCDVFECS